MGRDEDVHDRGAAQHDVLDAIGSPVVGLRGTAASAAGGPAGRRSPRYWKTHVTARSRTPASRARRSTRRTSRSSPRSRRCSASPAKIKANLIAVSGPPGAKVTYLQLGEGDQAAPRRQGRRLRGRVQPGRLRRERRHRLGRVRDLEVLGHGQDRHAEDRHLQGLDAERYREGGGFEEAAAYSRAVRIGPHVAVSGTAAREGGGAYEQTREAIGRRSLAAAESSAPAVEDVLRTRLLLGAGLRLGGRRARAPRGLRGRRTREHDLFRRGVHPRGRARRGRARRVVAEPPR